jgi:hypothetical protein
MRKIIIALLLIVNSLFGVMINGLDWQDEIWNEVLHVNYNDAQEYCIKINAKLPSVNELQDLYNSDKNLKYIKRSDYIANDGTSINFYDGRKNYGRNLFYVRCIRGIEKYTRKIKNNNGDVETAHYINKQKDGPYTILYKNGDKETGEYVDNEKKIKSLTKHKITKGYLVEDLILILPECDDVIDKDQFIQINLSNSTIELPKGYENITLKEIPKLYIPKDKRKIDINASIKQIHNKDFISFNIKTNLIIKTIQYNKKRLTILNNQDYLYITKPIREKDNTSLEIILKDGSEISYIFNNSKWVKKKKLDIE